MIVNLEGYIEAAIEKIDIKANYVDFNFHDVELRKQYKSISV